MSHFLTNLANRNLGLTAVIQPRPLSRYESQMVVTMDDTADLTTTITEAAVSAIETKQPFSHHHKQIQSQSFPEQADDPIHIQPQALAARLDRLSNSMATYRELHLPATPVTPLTPTSSPAQPNPEEPALTHPPDTKQVKTTTDYTYQSEPDTPTETQPTKPGHAPSNRPTVSSPAPAPAVAVSRSAKEPPVGANMTIKGVSVQPVAPPIVTATLADTSKRSLSQPAPVVTPLVTSQTGTSPDTAPTMLRPQIVSIPTPVARPARQGSAVEPPTAINVTIGRIEVKATSLSPPAAPKPARQTSSQPKAMSLDDYLRRRNRGSP
jgi:hypothetical protein